MPENSPQTIRFFRLPGGLALSVGCLALSVGCQPVSQPWAGTPYQSPDNREPLPSSTTYSPTPSILPSRAAERVDTASQDAAIKQFLLQQKP